MDLVLFDFDKTLTTKDSFIEFLKFSTPKHKFYWNLFLLSPTFVGYTLKLIDAQSLKNKFLYRFYCNIRESDLKNIGKEFSSKRIPKILNIPIYKRLKAHKNKGCKIVIVSASLDIWLEPWAKQHGVDLICTKAHYNNNTFTGRINGLNVKKQVKKELVLKHYDLSSFQNIIVYGNKNLDEYLFKLANNKENIHII
jgi:phosphatidylglycerophosphatase C